MTDPTEILVDPEVSRAKFAREIERFRALEEQHMRRGCWLVKAEYPTAFVIFATPKIQPNCVIFAAKFDFTDYDLLAPSVRLANAFTQELLKAKEVPVPMLRVVMVPAPPEIAAQGNLEVPQQQNLLQNYGPEELPFICLQGVREYHQHPLHSNDPWLSHRKSGEGTLNFLVEQIWKYGIEQLNGLNFSLNIAVNGFMAAGVSS